MNCMTQPHSATATFRAARDLLLRHREDFGAAEREFSWPQFGEFNWALDWFDVVAAEHPGQEALRVVTEDGVTSLTYGELAARSNQLANWLRGLGARRGDRLLLMLGNIAPLWEVILAAIKLGVVIIPASTLLGPEDLADRIDRGDVRHVVTETAHAGEVRRARLATGPASWWSPAAQPAGSTAGRTGRWHRYTEAFGGPEVFTPDGPTKASDPLLLYFTSGTTAQPKLVEHTQVSYPVGHLSTMYWIGLQPGDVHLNISSPGLGQARLEQRVRAVERRGDRADPRPRAVLRGGAAAGARRAGGDDVLRAAHGVADAAPVRPGGRRRDRAARVRRRGRAAQPRGHRAGPPGLGHHRPGRLRPDRDHRAGGQHPRPAGEAGLDGPAAARLPGGAGRPGHRRAGDRGRDSAWTWPAARSA